MLSCSSHKVAGLTLRFLIHLKLIFIQGEFQSSTCGYSVFPAPFIEETVFSPTFVFGAFVENQMPVAAWA
jgi:hypothetical protein